MKEYLKDKKYGFYVMLATMLISIVTITVYACSFGQSRYMSWAAFWVILVGIVLTAVLIVLKIFRFAPAVLFTTVFVGILLFIYYIYFFISSVMTGIQFSGFPPEFVACVVLFVLSLVMSIACVFMPMVEDK